MKNKSVIGTIASITCVAMLLSGCGGASDTAAMAADNVATDTSAAATQATSAVVADPLNVSYIQEHFACDEALASEISLTLAREGFGQITESTSISSTKAKIKDANGMINYLILDEFGVIIELIDENEAQLWANGSIAYTLTIPSDESNTTTTQIGDVEVTVSTTANTGSSIETSDDSSSADSSSLENDNEGASDNAATALTTVNSDFCKIEKIADGKYKVTPNGSLSDSTKIGNTTMGKIAAKLDETLTAGGCDSINRTLFYQLVSTTFYSYDGVATSMELDEARILAYLSSMTEGNTTLKYTEIESDRSTDYMKFTYYIGTSAVTVDTDNVVTWDGVSVDNIANILALFNQESSGSDSSANASTTAYTLETSAAVIDAANIKAVTENKASSKLAQEIFDKFGGYVTKITKDDSGWTATLDNGKTCLITYSIVNDKVTIKVSEDAKKDALVTITY